MSILLLQVQSRVSYASLSCIYLTKFQFLHGAIKGFSISAYTQLTPAFQFLHGAIKGFFVEKIWAGLVEFQFLHGAIKGKVIDSTTKPTN